jgi:phosphatidylserine/phosphatidylglycerophosphate/cardiolipin synthase-like enzyme
MDSLLSDQIRGLVGRAPAGWLVGVSETLRASPSTATADFVKKRLPATGNADLAHLLFKLMDVADGQVTWEALGFGLQVAYDMHAYAEASRQVEMLWSGPAPAHHLPARRIDQALYDLIATARNEILLVTFAAAKVDRLTAALLTAASRGVKIRLVLEFAEASEGQLSFDAIKAFPSALLDVAEVYYWPVEKRERNQAGRPGKLHAKIALIDEAVLVSSANLTDDAFNRNLEVGVRLSAVEWENWVRGYFDGLISSFNIVKFERTQLPV